MAVELQPVDPATNPYLRARLAPVHDEVDAPDLPVEGAIPPDLRGAFVRNGANPQFTPLGSYTYPMEGDAMLHGIWLGNWFEAGLLGAGGPPVDAGAR
jgi:carotenoid cleavage dioxygenase-like enzyme